MTQKYARDNVEVYELWSWYKRRVDGFADTKLPAHWWHYAKFSNDVAIPKSARRTYRNRPDLQREFPDPFEASGSSYYSWLVANGQL